MTKVINLSIAEHFTWGNVCDGWWLKKSGRFTVISETMPKGTSEIKHFHNETEQFFYILEGTLTIEFNDMTYELLHGDSIIILPGIAHRAYNHSAQSVKFLVVSSHDSHQDRIEL